MSTEPELLLKGDHWPFTLDQITDLTGAAVTDVAAWNCEWVLEGAGGVDLLTRSTGAGTITRGAGLFSWTVPPSDQASVLPGRVRSVATVIDPSGKRQSFVTVFNVQLANR
jgi:hypothetical protein